MKKRRNTSKISKNDVSSKTKEKERAKEQTLVLDKDHTMIHQVPTKKFLLYHSFKSTQITGYT
jgi:hypothetical protein